MAVLVFGTKLDEMQLAKVQALIGDIPPSGIAFSTISVRSIMNGSLSTVDMQLVADALFSTTKFRSVLYTFIDVDISHENTFMLVLDAKLEYFGMLKDDVILNLPLLSSIVSQSIDCEILKKTANDNFRYVRMSNDKTLKEINLMEIKDTGVRSIALQKGCGKKGLLKLAENLTRQIDDVALFQSASKI